MKRTPKICLISNPDSIHVQRWERHFSTRGFDVSLLSVYQPQTEPSSEASLHYLRPRSTAPSSGRARAATAAQRFPGLLRLFTAARYRAAGFYRELDRINPDLVHAHYVSDYGFLAALSRRHPLIVSAWGSDVLVDPGLSPITRQLVRWVLGRADLVTYDANQVRDVAQKLGAPSDHLLRVVLGRAAAYVSVPSSDGTSVTLLEAMAAGAYPIVSDLPANREWVNAEGGAVVTTRQVAPLVGAIVGALREPVRRASAATRNLELVKQHGLWDLNMARMEDAYRGLADAGIKSEGATR